MGEEPDKGGLFKVRGGSVGVITKASHGEIIWSNPTTDTGIRCGWGRTYHICGVLPHDSEVGGVPSAGMSVNGLQCITDERTFHVQIFLLKGCGAAVGERATAPLRHVQNAHAGGSSAQAPENGALLQ